MNKETTKMIPGDELHLTMLMAPYSLNLVTGQDRQHLLAFGRAAFEAGKAGQPAQCLHHTTDPKTAASMLRQCIDKATFPTHMDKHSALQWIHDLEAEADAERRHHGIRNASAVRTLHALGYTWRGADAWQPPAQQVVQAAVPDGWVPCVITFEGQHPEEIAYGPQAMMDRLKKWLDRYFEMRTAPAHTTQGVPASVVSGAVFDFAGYLTTLPVEKAIHASEAHEAAPMVEAITAWAAKRELVTTDANVERWRATLAAQPEQRGA